MLKKLRGITNIQNVTVSAASAGEVTQVADSIASLLRVRHKMQPGDPDDFMVRTMEEMASVRKEATQTMTALLASIAGVSLLVGGIGIMNIMLVSVTERTREIGLRMAIGARGRDVLLQFLVEAVVLSLFGGGIGIALGFGAGAGGDAVARLADGGLAQRRRGRIRLRGDDRRLLRLLSGAQGGRAGSYRRACDLNDANEPATCSWMFLLAGTAAVAGCSAAKPRHRLHLRGRRPRRRQRSGRAGHDRAGSAEIGTARPFRALAR